MAHYAEIIDRKVVRVLVTDNNWSETSTKAWLNANVSPELWVKCSYSGSIRDVFPGIGYDYDSELDIFVCPEVDEG